MFRLDQRLPDQARGFFEARGFDPAVTDEIAQFCVFQSILENTTATGGAAISFDLTEWRITTGSGHRPPLVREHWARAWQGRAVLEAARIAFEWSLLPTRQRYHPADYNWGMITFGPAFGGTFDLEFLCYRQDQHFAPTLHGIECTQDTPQPAAENALPLSC